jgi:imidazole glycerol-phosphate synthase subunit HisH
MIGIIDYGLGNLVAFENALARLRIANRRVHRPEDLVGCSKLIFPGVGSFDFAMKCFNESGLREPLDLLVRSAELPVLGVCVGMQMFANSSEEGTTEGLGWIPGRVRSMRTPAQNLPVPHMGWNDVTSKRSPETSLCETGDEFYFLHSYHFETETKDSSLATSIHGSEFSCVVGAGAVVGVQFHPEKSHQAGARLLRRFWEK